jgi:hypothetical protein
MDNACQFPARCFQDVVNLAAFVHVTENTLMAAKLQGKNQENKKFKITGVAASPLN